MPSESRVRAAPEACPTAPFRPNDPLRVFPYDECCRRSVDVWSLRAVLHVVRHVPVVKRIRSTECLSFADATRCFHVIPPRVKAYAVQCSSTQPSGPPPVQRVPRFPPDLPLSAVQRGRPRASSHGDNSTYPTTTALVPHPGHWTRHRFSP